MFFIALMLFCGISLQAQYNTGIGDGYARGIVINFEIPITLTAPVLTAPANLATGIAINPTLTWEVSANATSYRVQVSTTNDFTTPTINEVVAITSKELAGLANLSQYFWRVQAINGEQTSEWSEVRSFTTIKYIAPTSAELNITALLTGLWSNNTHKAAAIIVELRSGNVLSSSTLYKRISGILSETGEVSVLMNEITNGDYWLIIRSTGYLPIASAAKVSVQGGTMINYDFSRSTTSVFNANMLKAVNGRYLMKVGDLDSDSNISGADMSAVKANSGCSSTIPGL